MKKYICHIELTELSELLSYDPTTGLFRHTRDSHRKKAGAVVGRLDTKGYVRIRVLGYELKAHRLAWLFVHKEWPAAEIDHINGCPSDNRIMNLRDVTTAENGWNRKNPMRNNKTGLLGVCAYGNRFHAQIGVKGERRSLGFFDKAVDAHNAYMDAKAKLHVIP